MASSIQIKNNFKHKVSGQIELELFNEETNRSIDEKFLNDSSLQDFEVSPETELTVYFPIQIPLEGPESIYYRIWFHSDSTSEHGEINKVEKGTFYIHSFEMVDMSSITQSDNSLLVEKAYWTLDSSRIYTGQNLNIGDTLTFHLLLDVKKKIKELSVEFSFPACLKVIDDEFNTLTFEKLKKGRLEVFRSAIVKSAGLYNTGDGAIYKDGEVIYYMPNWEIRVSTPK